MPIPSRVLAAFRLAAAVLMPWVLLTPGPGHALAQEAATESSPSPIEIGDRYVIHSTILDEDRPIWIGLPDEYDDGDEPYPVVYLLDGQSNFHHTTGSVRFLADADRMPRAIVVGVGNISGEQRTRDMTPTPAEPEEVEGSSMMAAAGGASDFVRFLTEELRPWVDQRFRTRSYDILIGHSFGGLFITEVLNRAPGSFDAYISISPSLWWNEEAYVRGLEDVFERHPDATGSLYMTMGSEGRDMLSGAWTFAGILAKYAPSSFRWDWARMPEESHASVPYRSTHDGLEWIFEGWDPTPLVMSVVRDGEPIGPALDQLEVHYARTSERFGWDVSPDRRLLSDLGGYLSEEGRQDEALEALRRNVVWFPEAPETHGELADVLVQSCDWDEARRHYAHALSRAESTGNDRVFEYTEERMEALADRVALEDACGP